MTTPTEDEARAAADNVTRIHPAPSIPNPLMTNPWATLSDEDLEREILAASVRVDGAMHTKQSLEREQARRADIRGGEGV